MDSLGFAVEGPHQAEIKCRDLGNGKCEVIYYPTKPGEYTVHITCNGKDIPDSPFKVPITPGGDASKCYAEGPGLEPNGLVAGKFSTHDNILLIELEYDMKTNLGRVCRYLSKLKAELTLFDD